MHTLRSSKVQKPNIVITMGDPSGIGPEVTLKALASPEVRRLADFLVIGDRFVMTDIKKRAGLRIDAPLLDLANVPQKLFSYGKCCARFGKASIQYLDGAVRMIKEGKADFLVTAQVNKSSIRAAGLSGFKGHTEYLADKTRTKDYAMMFIGERLKVTLVTRHIELKSVSGNLSAEAIYRTIMLTHKYLKEYFGIETPRIGVAGLNPHAGEGGNFGHEEADLIAPAIKKASKEVKNISGPLPGDVIFYEAFNKKFDAVVAMYHDQGLIPFKMLYFKDGVNLTLGLPFIRTSPDHGTAFNIAGKGSADPSSMIEAILLACRLFRVSRR